MPTRRTCMRAGIALTLLALPAPAQRATSAETIRGPVDVPGFEAPVRRSLGLPGAWGAHNLTVVAPPDVAALHAADELAGPGPARIGVVLELEPADSSAGPWIALPDGGALWTHAFRAAGARAIRLRLADWDPPAGAQVTLHAADDAEARGPLDRRHRARDGRLWTHAVHADHVRLEYYLPPDVDPLAPAAQLRVDALTYSYRGPGRPQPAGGGPTAGGPLPCHLDWSCFPDWETEGLGVCAIDWISGSIQFFCSGALLNRVPGDFAPFVMTAFHCGVDDGNADSAEVRWLYQTDACDGTAPNPSTLPSALGCTVLAENQFTDWTLLGMGSLPGGLTYLGWDSAPVPVFQPVVGIHHPAGSWKRISAGQKESNGGWRPDPSGATTCISGTGHFVDWNAGLVEPGSSGSPLFDGFSKKVIGVLSCGSWNCDSTDSGNYGRLYQVYGVLEPFLDPVDPIYADAGHAGNEEGTVTEPFNSFKEAYYAVIAGSDVYLTGGSYPEQLVVERPMTLHRLGPGPVVIGD